MEKHSSDKCVFNYVNGEAGHIRNKISETHNMLKELHSSHTSIEKIADVLEEIKDKFIDVVIGKGVIQLDTHNKALEEQRRVYIKIINTLCITFGVILALLIGLKYVSPHWFQ